MIISVDTEIIISMASVAQNAREALEASVSAMVPVTEHNDWNCKERDSINENILSIKNKHKKLQEAIESFSDSMKNIANQFNAFEQSIPAHCQQVEAALGATFSIPTVNNGVVEIQQVEEWKHVIVPNGKPPISPFKHLIENYEVENMFGKIQVCNYTDVLLHK